jgi:hypothetical protein
MASIPGIEPAAAPNGAHAREQNGGRSASELHAERGKPRPRASARQAHGEPPYQEAEAGAGLLVDIEV